MFQLDERLMNDSVLVGQLSLCELRVINDCQFPWFILVPKRAGVKEIYQLSEDDRSTLMAESCLLAEAIHDSFSADKLNIAAIGNKVTQLHLHHVARFEDDACWPEPIWGKKSPIPYTDSELANILQKVRTLLEDHLHVSEASGELYY
ncbi:HIT domain-containing protein [Marinomonas balearica]|uniref:Diadenosine tetraphosphate (Ap4A) HIT family hydrolase n=1 Tax=Marinomonas balearica TaxID=491947 RepID=A0A4R6MC29_9GAMM|nr:HIT domain-containing protein [Marinomonas balearica]TDO99034.1 diadenosine tetraphosphate (Ap4A) HIT family hydrolase [Marinomonas balearica]